MRSGAAGSSPSASAHHKSSARRMSPGETMSQDSPTAVVIDNPVIRMHPADNLVVARVDLPPGVPIDDGGLVSLHAVQAGNKIASRAIAKGEPIRKYDTTIGFAITDIAPGEPIGADRIEYREFDR